MSRTRILGASLVALMISVGGAAAADIYAPPPAGNVIYSPTSAFSWTGGYAGGFVGYEWGDAKVKGGPNPDPDGWMGGIFGGYNVQTSGAFVVGVETDLSLSGADDKAGGVRVENTWNGTVRARAGVAINRVLLYGTGGLAVGNVKVKIPGDSDSSVRAGWTLGAGIEAALANNVIGRVEYRYTDLGGHTYKTSPKTHVDFQSSQVMVGLGVKF
jgi:outer membrane immunogenic protein